MYSVNQPIKKVGVVPEKIMYEVEPVQGSVLDKLESAGNKVDNQIKVKKVQLLEKQVDDMLNLLTSQKSTTTKVEAKNSVNRSKLDSGKIQIPRFEFKKIEQRFQGCELLVEVTMDSSLELFYHTLSILQQNLKLSCRVHAHSTLNTAETKKALSKINSDLISRNVKVNSEVSRATKDFDINVAILVRKVLEETECQLSIFSFTSTKVQGQLPVSKFLWQMAGGKFTENDNFWLSSVNDRSKFVSSGSFADIFLTC